MALNLFIIGPSGCGKSTQAKLIAEKYNLTHYSTGQLLRDEIAANSELGLKAKSYIDGGNLVPDEILFTILTTNLTKINNQNFIIDGFPRMLSQGQFIENYLSSQNQPLDLIIHLDVTFEEIQARRAARGVEFQDAARTDNTPEAMAARQKFYDDNNGLIMDYFQAKNLLFRVNGNRPIEPIFEDICQKVNSLPQN
ncbi:MAG: nucleoside monophosphate kinase [Candidatus Shapirobacteria bacterium]|nr:nucleoside monophosphate kinase [Candidatus Shapirobacteria bacterium]MDD4410689.1 nucleoside monophosphate kinase [Candidatus Shapirobacteria bacterium]